MRQRSVGTDKPKDLIFYVIFTKILYTKGIACEPPMVEILSLRLYKPAGSFLTEKEIIYVNMHDKARMKRHNDNKQGFLYYFILRHLPCPKHLPRTLRWREHLERKKKLIKKRNKGQGINRRLFTLLPTLASTSVSDREVSAHSERRYTGLPTEEKVLLASHRKFAR